MWQLKNVAGKEKGLIHERRILYTYVNVILSNIRNYTLQEQ